MKNGGALSKPCREVPGLNRWWPSLEYGILSACCFQLWTTALVCGSRKSPFQRCGTYPLTLKKEKKCVWDQVGALATEEKQKEYLGKPEILPSRFHLFHYRIGPCSITCLFCVSGNIFNFDLNSFFS